MTAGTAPRDLRPLLGPCHSALCPSLSPTSHYPTRPTTITHHTCFFCRLTTFHSPSWEFTPNCCQHSSCKNCKINRYREYIRCWACERIYVCAWRFVVRPMKVCAAYAYGGESVRMWMSLERGEKGLVQVDLEEVERVARWRNREILEMKREMRRAEEMGMCGWCGEKREGDPGGWLKGHLRTCGKTKDEIKVDMEKKDEGVKETEFEA